MTDAVMILVGGLLGSAHCVGMCGGFALTLGSVQRSVAGYLARQFVYSVGRVFTYSMAGAMAGFGGWRLSMELRDVVNVQAGLSIVAGILLIVQGLFSAGLLPRRRVSVAAGCPGANSFAALLRARDWHAVFLAGLLNGLLPCGLVYAYLALASSSGGMLTGAATMALFGLGTIPALALTGLGGSLLSVNFRRHIFVIAAWCMILTGALALARGIGFLEYPGNMSEPACPLCD